MKARLRHKQRDMSLTEAVQYELTPDPYSYEGQLGLLAAQIELQNKMLLALVGGLDAQGLLTKETIANMLPSYIWELIDGE